MTPPAVAVMEDLEAEVTAGEAVAISPTHNTLDYPCDNRYTTESIPA